MLELDRVSYTSVYRVIYTVYSIYVYTEFHICLLETWTLASLWTDVRELCWLYFIIIICGIYPSLERCYFHVILSAVLFRARPQAAVGWIGEPKSYLCMTNKETHVKAEQSWMYRLYFHCHMPLQLSQSADVHALLGTSFSDGHKGGHPERMRGG